MSTNEILTILFSSTLISTVITIIFNTLTSKKKESIENITKERKTWRDQLRVIAKSIEESKNSNQLKIAISELKVRINAYGIANNLIFSDSHLWQIINDIESHIILSDQDFEKSKSILVNQISCLLKYDWERSKAEIIGNKQTKIVIISLILSFSFYSIRWFYFYGIGAGKIMNYLSYCVLYVLIVVFSIIVIYFANKWVNSFQYHTYIIACSLGGILLYYFVYKMIPSARSYDIIDILIWIAPYIALIYSAEIKLLTYKKNARNFILATVISSGQNVINNKYKIFFKEKELINICTGEKITFGDPVVFINQDTSTNLTE